MGVLFRTLRIAASSVMIVVNLLPLYQSIKFGETSTIQCGCG